MDTFISLNIRLIKLDDVKVQAKSVEAQIEERETEGVREKESVCDRKREREREKWVFKTIRHCIDSFIKLFQKYIIRIKKQIFSTKIKSC